MVRQPLHARADDKRSGEQIPLLEPGDRLTRDEFERRYAAMPRGIKAELLEGSSICHRQPVIVAMDGHIRT